MGDIVKLKPKNIRSDKEKELTFFFSQLDCIKKLYISGEIDHIFILANGKVGKCCTSNMISVKSAKQMCNDFIYNYEEYVDKEDNNG